jgi:hypothetical protein
VVEGARLESVCRGNSTVGSNPTLSANYFSLFFLSISHEINETRILFATASFFAEMLSNSAIPQAEIARATHSPCRTGTGASDGHPPFRTH